MPAEEVAWPRSATCRCRSTRRPPELDRPRPISTPATVAAATGGFVLGVAAFVLMRVLRRPSAARGLARRRGRLDARRRGVDVQATRSFLVDVHLLKR